LYLLQRIRDEAHRFAITHHRQRRSKSMLDSTLDAVPGLGPTRIKALRKRFSSFKALRAASVAELAEVDGIGLKTAELVFSTLAGQQPKQAVNVATGEIIEIS
jgi:excinuclease ABC subunit C